MSTKSTKHQVSAEPLCLFELVIDLIIAYHYKWLKCIKKKTNSASHFKTLDLPFSLLFFECDDTAKHMLMLVRSNIPCELRSLGRQVNI